MNILHVLDHSIPLHSGYTFRTRAILKAQHDLGWETTHLTSPKHTRAAGWQGDAERVGVLEFHRTPDSTGWASRIPAYNQWREIGITERALDKLVGTHRPDIIHAHSPALNGLAAVRVGRKHNIPVVYEIRAFWEDAAVDHGTAREGGLRYRLSRMLETHVTRSAQGVTVICDGLRKDLEERGVGSKKITVIPNGVDVDRFSTMAEKDIDLLKTLGLEGKSLIGFIGSFYAYEGLDVLLQALPQLVERDSDVRLLLVGGGPEEPKLRRMVAGLKMDAYVVFTGRVPHQEVERYYHLVDIFVYPRRSMRLTDLVTPLKPLEAMAQGKVVAASDVGGHRELIRPGKNGVLFKAGDPESLAEAVSQLLNDPNQCAHLRSEGRGFVEQERTWPEIVKRYERVYKAAQAAL